FAVTSKAELTSWSVSGSPILQSAPHSSVARGLSVAPVALSNSQYALPRCPKAQTGSPAPVPRGRHRLVFRATDFHFHHHVFCDDLATKKATGTATEIDWQSEERRARDHECRFKPNENSARKICNSLQ